MGAGWFVVVCIDASGNSASDDDDDEHVVSHLMLLLLLLLLQLSAYGASYAYTSSCSYDYYADR